MESSAVAEQSRLAQMGFQKGSFGYKMSKKVAELTQVVHMLFTRNHEREVELDELREAYEQEITNVIKDAKTKIEKLEYQLRESERRRKRESNEVAGNTAQLLREAQERMEAMKNDILEEKRESTHLRDLLTQAHKDLERLKHGSTGVSGDLQKKSKILEEREREFQKLWQMHVDTESKLKASNKYSEETKKQLDLAHDESEKIKFQLERNVKVSEEKNRRNEDLQRNIKLMEDEIKHLKRELNKIMRDQSKDKVFERRIVTSVKDGGNSGDRTSKTWKEELYKIKRENEWLRNELRNREGNFNRVFATFQPVFVGSNLPNRTHQDILQERDMMMVTPSPIFTPTISSTQNSLADSPTNFDFITSRRRTPNLTGLEPKIKSMVPSPTPFRPPTRSGVAVKNIQSTQQPHSNSNFRLIYTK